MLADHINIGTELKVLSALVAQFERVIVAPTIPHWEIDNQAQNNVRIIASHSFGRRCFWSKIDRVTTLLPYQTMHHYQSINSPPLYESKL